MRRLAIVVALVACNKDASQDVVAATPSPGFAPKPPSDAGTDLIELLHAVPATIRLSSRVANKAILPTQIADRDFNTAWNSRTGDLVGAWVDVEAPGARIMELRFTVGHTGKGEHGEDYFTMNPRISKLALLDGSTVIATTDVDINSRELQRVRLAKPLDQVRLRVDALTPGSKPSWRETCISEIEAWGYAPSGVTPSPRQPVVEVSRPPEQWMNPPYDVASYCDRWMAAPQKAYDKAMAEERAACDACQKEHVDENGTAYHDVDPSCCNPDPPAPPACSIAIARHVTTGNWRGAGVIRVATDSYWGTATTQIVVATPRGAWPVGEEYDCSRFDGTACELVVDDAHVNEGGQLELRATLTRRDSETSKDVPTRLAYICQPAQPSAPIACATR